MVLQPIADMEVDEGSGPFVIDLEGVFFDPDNDPKTLFHQGGGEGVPRQG